MARVGAIAKIAAGCGAQNESWGGDMKTIWMYCLGLVCVCQCARAEVAEVPGTGRWEDLAYSSSEINRLTQLKYANILSDYSSRKQLDQDRQLIRRVKAIGETLVGAAMAVKPSAKDWNWEFHTTSDQNVDAFCMAGGKLIIGEAFVKQLKLNDGELAMLIAHEVAHAVAEHHREELSEVLRISGRRTTRADVLMAQLDADFTMQIRLADLSNQQETEADHLGMILAHRAGWLSKDMVTFFKKLASSPDGAMIGNAYPAMSSRVSMAIGMAKLFDY